MNRCHLVCVTLVALLGIAEYAIAQDIAIAGRPFGVARITIPRSAAGESAGAHNFEIREKNGRIFYPVFNDGQVGQFFSELFGFAPPISVPQDTTVSFLFTGESPLEMALYTPEERSFVLTPTIENQGAFDAALSNWWRDYHAKARELERIGDYPPMVQTYLVSMLSRRLGLQTPFMGRIRQSSSKSEMRKTLELVFNVEKLRTATLRETMQGGSGLTEVANLPVPPEVVWSPTEFPSTTDSIEIEPIALHVPEECCYLRFGNFPNYFWMNRLLGDYGGDISQMVTLRGHNAHQNDRFQQQIALKQNVLAEVLGPQVIADVAIIGQDMYMREGAAMGVLFQAKNNFALGTDINRQRQEAILAMKAEGATLETVTIAGHEVSFLSTPDNRLRSFYAVDGDFHLVSTSKTIVHRFYEAGDGVGTLGASAEFHYARQAMPVSREDTVFAYFSPMFFSNLLSPSYQIELSRRMQAVTDIELVQLARLAAESEGYAAGTLNELVDNGFLPEGFGRRGDGSGPILEVDRVIDSKRGARGTFLPIPDVPLRAVTASESAKFVERADYYQSNWQQMDPLMVGVKRFDLDGKNLERIVIDANVSPLVEEKYGWVMSLLAAPSGVEITSPEENIINFQAAVKGGLLNPSIPTHHLFLGVMDLPAGVDLRPTGILQVLRILRTTPGYLGAWPKFGFLDLLPRLGRQSDFAGFQRLPFGLWRWKGGDFSLLSFDRDVLARGASASQAVATENPAQIRLRVGDLSNSQLAGYVRYLNYNRSYQASLGNASLLNAIHQQLHIPKDQALQTAQRLLDTELVCTLRGEYKLVEGTGRSASWQSTAWPSNGELPEDYEAPLLTWFRGTNVELTKYGDELVTHAEIDMQRHPHEPKLALPKFDLFGAFGSGIEAAARKEDGTGTIGAGRKASDEPDFE